MGSSADGGSGGSSEHFFDGRQNSRGGVVEWVLVEGDRIALTAGGTVLVYAILLGLYAADAIAFTNANSITRMGSGMIAGMFSLVTLVVSVNQLILSQEFSPAGQFRDRLDGIEAFRGDVADVTHVPATPAEPTRMLALIIAAIRDRAGDLDDVIAEHRDEAYRSLVASYADSVVANADRVDELLDRGDVSASDALIAAVKYDEGAQLRTARYLRNDPPELSDRESAAFDELIDALRLFRTAQAHFKTIYLQRELTRFSQLTVYFGVPAILAASLITLVYGDFSGLTIDVEYAPYVTSLLVTIVFVPLMLLAAYILRIATLARRTAEIGPMAPQKDSDEGPLEVSYGDQDADE